MALFSGIKNWYTKYEQLISSLSLVGGFIFNALTLKRVDLFWENFWVVAHLLIVAICIFFINRGENHAGKETPKSHFWFTTIMQLMFGGLLSTYLVFYFRSTTFSVTWPFLLLLALAFLANERFKKHSARLVYHISLFYISLFSFSIFIVPVFFHKISEGIFVLSGLLSLVVLDLFLLMLKRFAREKFKQSKIYLILSIGTIFIGINVLYFFHLIPPIPLSLKEGGIYHSVIKDGAGNYIVQKEEIDWERDLIGYIKTYRDIHVAPGEWIYAYSAIFSPPEFETGIVHQWQYFDVKKDDWVTRSTLSLKAVGGREGGFRTYSKKSSFEAGKWRVNVKTSDGHIIGQLRFNIIPVDVSPLVVSEVKY